jgi:hypothetical protein
VFKKRNLLEWQPQGHVIATGVLALDRSLVLALAVVILQDAQAYESRYIEHTEPSPRSI